MLQLIHFPNRTNFKVLFFHGTEPIQHIDFNFCRFPQMSKRNYLLPRRRLVFYVIRQSNTYITIPLVLIFQQYLTQVKEAFGFSPKNSSGSTCSSTDHGADTKKHGSEASFENAKDQHPGSSGSSETFFGKFKSSIPSPGISSAFERLKSTKLIDLAKRGYEVVKDELSGKPHKKKHLEYEPSASPKVERSTRTDVVVLPSKQSRWSKKWEAFREKVNFLSC